MIKIESGTRYLRISCGELLEDNIIWCSQVKQNVLYKINLDCQKIEYVCDFPIDEVTYTSFSNTIYEEGLLYFIPFAQEYFVIYHLSSGKMDKINVKNGKKEKYGVGAIVNECIFLFPFEWNGRIAMIDKENQEVHYQYNLFGDLEKFLNGKIHHLFGSSYLYKETLYFPIIERSVLVEYHCNTREYGFYWIDQVEDKGFLDCEGKGEQLYLLDNMGTVFVFDIKTKDVKKIFGTKEDMLYPYLSLHVFGDDEIWLVPWAKNEIVIYNTSTRKITFQNIVTENYKIGEGEHSQDVKNGYKFRRVFRKEDILWLYPDETNLLVRVDMKTREQEGISIMLPQEYIISLNNLLDCVAIDRKVEMSANLGVDIWKEIKNVF